MGYKLLSNEVNNLFEELKREYMIYAPKRFLKQGRYSDTDIIKYGEVNSFQEIVYKEKSTYPAKELITPINQTLYFFTEDEFRESKNPYGDKKILIFARPCDINAQKRQDKIYLENGGFEDAFYKRIREKVKFVCIECVEGFDTCFCTTMGSNKTDDYSLAVRFDENSALFNINDNEFDKYFTDCAKEEFELKFIEKNMAEVNLPEIESKEVLNKLKVLDDVGLSYVKLGQSAPTLSGGEAARVKLAKELQKKPTGKTVFILDEPTTGLHQADIKKLLAILERIVDNGDTVIIIEHNLDVIKVADYIIDLGPEGGSGGGTVVAIGTPEQVADNPNSYTGEFLKEILKK